jgi:hypothetical protein
MARIVTSVPCEIARAKSNTNGTATLALATVRELQNGAWVSLKYRHVKKLAGRHLRQPPATTALPLTVLVIA